jgi:serine/threonine-protein kinase RsbW
VKPGKEELTIPSAKLEDLTLIIDRISNWLNGNGFESIAPAVLTAIDEAFTNIIKYAYSGNPGFLSISWHRQDNSVVINIKDTGKPFDPSSINPPELDLNLEDRTVGGLGIHLIKVLMDEISYSGNPDIGNTLTMKKSMPRYGKIET